jgi:hypothetical protein
MFANAQQSWRLVSGVPAHALFSEQFSFQAWYCELASPIESDRSRSRVASSLQGAQGALNLETERPKEAVEVELPDANVLGPASAAKAHPDLFSVFFGI